MAANRQLLDLRLDRGELRLSFNALRLLADDPQGLNRSQWDNALESTESRALAFNTRKDSAHWQLGAGWRGGNAWMGQRKVTQWQPIPVAVQAEPGDPGGVSYLARNFAGFDLRASHQLGSASVITGVAFEGQRDDRQGFENFIGTQLGQSGALRRDERNTALGLDLYAQWRLPLRASTILQTGGRSGRLQMRSEDSFLGNGDDSGMQWFHTLSPLLGITHRPDGGWSLYAHAGSAQETPTE